MNTTLKTILLGLGGLALAILLSLGAFALAGRSLGEPTSAVPVLSPSTDGRGHGSSGDDASPAVTPSQAASRSDTPSPSTSSSDDHGGGSDDDHSGSGGGGSDDPSGDDHGGTDHGGDDD